MTIRTNDTEFNLRIYHMSDEEVFQGLLGAIMVRADSALQEHLMCRHEGCEAFEFAHDVKSCLLNLPDKWMLKVVNGEPKVKKEDTML